MKEKPYLSFREDHSFRILHLTDIQEGLFPRKDTFRLLEAVLKSADPDLVILTGDQLKGYEPLLRLSGRSGIEKTIKRLMEPLEQSGVPYAVTFGNHDVQCGLSNEEQAKIYRQLSGCICGDDGSGAGTFFLRVHNRSGEIIFMIYVLDSGNTGEKGCSEKDAIVRRSLLGILLCVFFYFMASNAVTTAFSKYARNIWGASGGSFANFQLVATLVTLISYMPMAGLSCRIGRKNTTYIGIGLMCLGGMTIFTISGYTPLIYLWVSVSGVGMGTVATTIYPMIMEVASENTTGRYTGYYYTASMSAQIITPILSGAVMEFIGYRFLYLYAVVCALLAGLPLLLVKKGNTVLLKDLKIKEME